MTTMEDQFELFEDSSYGGKNSTRRLSSNQSIIKKPWTNEEDDRLRHYVMINGTSNWSVVAEHMPDRSGKQCRERWHNHLSPDVNKSAWTEEEDRIIITMQEKIGNQWSKITKLLPGRSDNAVKNRFHMAMRAKNRELRTQLGDAITDDDSKACSGQQPSFAPSAPTPVGTQGGSMYLVQLDPTSKTGSRSPITTTIQLLHQQKQGQHQQQQQQAYYYTPNIAGSSTSPVILPNQNDFPIVVPVIQSFPSPPLSPNTTVAMDQSTSHESSVMKQVPLIPFAEAQLFNQAAYLQQSQSVHHVPPPPQVADEQSWLNNANDDSFMEGIDFLDSAPPSAVMSPATIMIDETGVEAIDLAEQQYDFEAISMLADSPITNVSDASTTVGPAFAFHHDGQGAGFYVDPTTFTLQQQQLLQHQREQVNIYLQQQQQQQQQQQMVHQQHQSHSSVSDEMSEMMNTEAQRSSITHGEPDISVDFMHENSNDMLLNWSQQDISTYSSGSHLRQSIKRCGTSNWCGVSLIDSSSHPHQQQQLQQSHRWGTHTSAFCGFGASSGRLPNPFSNSAMSFAANAMHSSTAALGGSSIGMGAGRESPVRKQPRASSAWRMGW